MEGINVMVTHVGEISENRATADVAHETHGMVMNIITKVYSLASNS